MTGPSSRSISLKVKLFFLLVLFAIFVFSGLIRVNGRTPLEHLDRLFGMDYLQDAHDDIVDFVSDVEVDVDTSRLERGAKGVADRAKGAAKDAAKGLKDAGKRAVDSVRKGGDSKKSGKKTNRKFEKPENKDNPVIEEERGPGKKPIRRLKELEKPMGDITEKEQKELEEILEGE